MMNSLEMKFFEYGIDYITEGKNCGKDDINIRCTQCNDESKHLGIHATKGCFYCLRCPSKGGWRTLEKLLDIKLGDVFGGQKDELDISWAQKFDKPDRLKDFYTDPTDKHMKMWRFLLEERQLDPKRCYDGGLKKGINSFKGYAVFTDEEMAIGRNYLNNDNIKWKKPRGWKRRLYGANWVEATAPKIGVIVEGVFDMLRFPIGTAAALLSKQITDDIATEIDISFRPSCKKLILGTDRDLKKFEKLDLMMKLRGLGFEVSVPDWSQVDPDVKDLDEFFVRYGEDAMYEFLGIPKLEDPKII